MHVYLCAESERTDCVLTALMETLQLSGILFWVYVLIGILINHLVQFKTRVGLGWPNLVFSVIMSLQSNDRLFNSLVLGSDSACFFEFTNFYKLDTSDKGIPPSNGEKNYYFSTKPNVVGGRILQRACKDPTPSHSCFRTSCLT